MEHPGKEFILREVSGQGDPVIRSRNSVGRLGRARSPVHHSPHDPSSGASFYFAAASSASATSFVVASSILVDPAFMLASASFLFLIPM
jgi:hypothetical protein